MIHRLSISRPSGPAEALVVISISPVDGKPVHKLRIEISPHDLAMALTGLSEVPALVNTRGGYALPDLDR